MKLIERYVREVGRHLPRRLRGDVERELLSTLEDALEARDQKIEGMSEDDAELAILADFGPPEKMAASYRRGPPYLVGPRLYPGFLVTVKICLGILAVLFLVGMIFGDWDPAASPLDWGKHLAVSLGNLMSEAIGLLGWVVLIFAVIERVDHRPSSPARPWDPRTLPAVEDPHRLNRSDLYTGLGIWILLLLLFNYFPEKIGAMVSSGGHTQFVPLLGPGFASLLPLMNLYLIAALVLGFFLFRFKRWNQVTRWADFGIQVILVTLFSRLLATDQVMVLSAEAPILRSLFRVAVSLGMIGAVVALGFKLLRAVRATSGGTR